MRRLVGRGVQGGVREDGHNAADGIVHARLLQGPQGEGGSGSAADQLRGVLRRQDDCACDAGRRGGGLRCRRRPYARRDREVHGRQPRRDPGPRFAHARRRIPRHEHRQGRYRQAGLSKERHGSRPHLRRHVRDARRRRGGVCHPRPRARDPILPAFRGEADLLRPPLPHEGRQGAHQPGHWQPGHRAPGRHTAGRDRAGAAHRPRGRACDLHHQLPVPSGRRGRRDDHRRLAGPDARRVRGGDHGRRTLHGDQRNAGRREPLQRDAAPRRAKRP